MNGILRTIDARALLPPEPMELTLAALDEIGPGQEIVLLLYREPYPLYQILQQNGFAHRTALQEDGTFEIHIFHAD
jgi:uncharacterized protein (DUF2249 family)